MPGVGSAIDINTLDVAAELMKTYIILLLLLFLSYHSHAQSVKSSEILQKNLVELIGSIDDYESFAGKQLMVKIFKVSNGSGSANFPESHEVSFNMLICVAHYDENPQNKLFTIGPFINPKVVKTDDSGKSVKLYIEDGVINKRKTTKVIVSETKVQIQ